MSEPTTTPPALHQATQDALAAFQAAERARLLADRRDRELRVAAARMAVEAPPEDRAAYLAETDRILADYAAKRTKAGLV
jgi:hypothetical protein